MTLSLAVLLFAFSYHTAHAITLTNCNEASLSAALTAGGTIQFGCNGTIVVRQTLLVTRDTTLDASGRTVLLSGVIGESTTRVLQVNPGVNLRLINIIVTNGYAPYGSGIYNNGGVVTAESCTFGKNQAVSLDAYGGAIWNSGTLTLTKCAFNQNAARGQAGGDGLPGTPGFVGGPRCVNYHPVPGMGGAGQPGGNALGGAIYNDPNGAVSIVDCAFDSNTAIGGNGGKGGDGGILTPDPGSGCGGGYGPAGLPGVGGLAQGGVIHNSGDLEIIRSTMAENTARGGAGGVGGRTSGLSLSAGIGWGGSGGSAAAGAIWNAGNLFLTNSTIADNQAVGGTGGATMYLLYGCFNPQWNGPGGNSEAGAIFSSGIVVTENVTIWNNEAHGGAGGSATNPAPARAHQVSPVLRVSACPAACVSTTPSSAILIRPAIASA